VQCINVSKLFRDVLYNVRSWNVFTFVDMVTGNILMTISVTYTKSDDICLFGMIHNALLRLE
jgi:hypothetical protein